MYGTVQYSTVSSREFISGRSPVTMSHLWSLNESPLIIASNDWRHQWNSGESLLNHCMLGTPSRPTCTDTVNKGYCLCADFGQQCITGWNHTVISADHYHWVIIAPTDSALIIGTADYGGIFTIFLHKKNCTAFLVLNNSVIQVYILFRGPCSERDTQ